MLRFDTTHRVDHHRHRLAFRSRGTHRNRPAAALALTFGFFAVLAAFATLRFFAILASSHDRAFFSVLRLRLLPKPVSASPDRGKHRENPYHR